MGTEWVGFAHTTPKYTHKEALFLSILPTEFPREIAFKYFYNWKTDK